MLVTAEPKFASVHIPCIDTSIIYTTFLQISHHNYQSQSHFKQEYSLEAMSEAVARGRDDAREKKDSTDNGMQGSKEVSRSCRLPIYTKMYRQLDPKSPTQMYHPLLLLSIAQSLAPVSQGFLDLCRSAYADIQLKRSKLSWAE